MKSKPKKRPTEFCTKCSRYFGSRQPVTQLEKKIKVEQVDGIFTAPAMVRHESTLRLVLL